MDPGPVTPFRLDVWPTPEQERSGAAPIGAIEVGPDGARLVGLADPVLQAAVAAIAAEPHLPLAERRPLEGGGRAVGLRRLAPGDADYPQAFAEAVGRRTAYQAFPG